MGLTIHYKIKPSARWSWDQTLAKLRAVHAFASTLAVDGVDDDLTILEGDDCNFNLQTDDEKRWDAIKTYRHIDNPWQPGTTTTDFAQRAAQFRVDLADGSEWLYIGIADYADHVWEPNTLERSSKGRTPTVPNWLGVLEDKHGFYPKESAKIIRGFMRKYQLKKSRKGRRFGKYSHAPSWVGATWHSVNVENEAYNELIGVGETKTTYRSHSRGWAPNAAIIYFNDPARGYSNEKLILEFKCGLEEARRIVDTREFKRDLKALATGKKSVTPADMFYNGFCKTHYAIQCGGLPNFLQAHLSAVAIFDKMIELGFKVEVSDEGDFWETRDLDVLSKEIGQQAAMVAAFAGALKDALGDNVKCSASGADFERLEFEGQKLVSKEQLEGIVKVCNSLVDRQTESAGENAA